MSHFLSSEPTLVHDLPIELTSGAAAASTPLPSGRYPLACLSLPTPPVRPCGSDLLEQLSDVCDQYNADNG